MEKGKKLIILEPGLKVMVMGPQGSGKSTQVELLSNNLGLPSISTGKLCREAIASGSQLGKQVKEYVDKGQYVTDEIIMKVIKSVINQEDMQMGFIGEGFPRTLIQVEALEGLFSVVFYIRLSEELSLKRLSSRRICKSCGATYNLLTNPSKKEGICDACKGELMKRDDDTEELILARLRAYREQTEPVLSHYRKQGILEEIDGQKSIEEIQDKIIGCLVARGLVKYA